MEALLNMGWVTSLVIGLPVWAKMLTAVVTATSIITAATPTKLDDKYSGIFSKVVNGVLKVLNMLSLNVGKNKNADDK